MLKPLSVSLACGSYDRVRGLLEGRVPTDGLEIHYMNLNKIPEIFFRSATYQEFDITEFSLSSYLTSLDSPARPFVAVPVFLSRAFRHGNIYVSQASGIQRPEDLKGKRIGVTEYGTTASVWIRGMLQDEYGVRPEQMEWFSWREEKLQAERRGIKLHTLPKGKFESMLEQGLVDAVLGSMFIKGPGVRRLLPNYRELEITYYRRTGIFPIMHVLAIKRSLYEAHAWIARTLYKAFDQARELCRKQLEQTSVPPVMMPWLHYYLEEQRELLGEDIWSYGVDKNRATLEAFSRYMHEQGLASRAIGVDEMFVPYRYTNVPD